MCEDPVLCRMKMPSTLVPFSNWHMATSSGSHETHMSGAWKAVVAWEEGTSPATSVVETRLLRCFTVHQEALSHPKKMVTVRPTLYSSGAPCKQTTCGLKMCSQHSHHSHMWLNPGDERLPQLPGQSKPWGSTVQDWAKEPRTPAFSYLEVHTNYKDKAIGK